MWLDLLDDEDQSGIKYLIYGKEHWDIAKMILEYKIVPINICNHLDNFNNLVKLLDDGDRNLSQKTVLQGYWGENDKESSIFTRQKWVKVIEEYYIRKKGKITPHFQGYI